MSEMLDEQVQKILAGMDNQEKQEQDTQIPQEGKDIYVLIVRERKEADDQPLVVESTPAVPTQHAPVIVTKDTSISAYMFMCFSLFLIVSTLAFQLYCMVNPPIATITIIPKSQQVTLSGTLQLGRLLNPITISQSQTTATTGKGHQDAKTATGYITFYNGQQAEQTISQGTVFTGNDSVSIETTQSATIPPGNPSTGYGTVTVTAQALEAGSKGNIQAGDVNTPIALAIFVTNNQFTGGQDERDFSTVSQQDITKLSTPLKISLAQSITGALQAQLKTDEQLQLLPCTPQVTTDHPIAAEATQVKVTVSQTCSAVAYNRAELATKATAFLATQALQKTGAGYSLFGQVQVSVKDATISHTTTPLVFLSFSASGTWVYALSQPAQHQIKHLIAGTTLDEALQLLASLPGVERASIRFSGFGDATRLPKTTGYMHVILIVL